MTSTTSVNTLNVYSVENLNQNCVGEVSAIEYCYHYSVGQGQAVFNWTVLILENLPGNRFMITNLYVIDSRPDSLDSGSCMNTNNGQMRKCCDVEQISGFNLSVNFVFGVTGHSQGNTHSASLLGFSDALPQYRVDTTLLSSADLSLSIGSTVPSVPVVQRGLRMLWFVIGELRMCKKYDHNNILIISHYSV